MYQYCNTKTFLQKVTFQIGLKNFNVIKKSQNSMPWTFNGEEIIGNFYKKELQRQIKQNLG